MASRSLSFLWTSNDQLADAKFWLRRHGQATPWPAAFDNTHIEVTDLTFTNLWSVEYEWARGSCVYHHAYIVQVHAFHVWVYPAHMCVHSRSTLLTWATLRTWRTWKSLVSPCMTSYQLHQGAWRHSHTDILLLVLLAWWQWLQNPYHYHAADGGFQKYISAYASTA